MGMMAASLPGCGASDRAAAVELMGVRLDGLTASQVLERIRNGLRSGDGGWIVTANLDIVRQVANDDDQLELVRGADLVVADGAPVVWASKLQGTPVPERVAGSDLIWTSCEVAADEGESVFLLGGNIGCADAAAQRLGERYPALRLAGTACPDHGFEHDPEQVRLLAEQVRASGAGLVLVGLGFPKQERLIRELRRVHPDAWYMGIGISFSFVSEEVRRAPVWMQRAGLEWVHRMVQEPRRLVRRYLWHGAPFGLRLMAAALSARGTA